MTVLLFVAVVASWTGREDREMYMSPVTGGFSCSSSCTDLDSNPSDETDISTVDPKTFDDCVNIYGTLLIDENTTLSNA
jgi:hypothetical protein